MPSRNELFNPKFVSTLFDEMAKTYGLVNLISSLGFALVWRRACVRSAHIKPASKVVDLMTGMRELCPNLAKASGPKGHISAIDISPAMCIEARKRGAALAQQCSVEVIEADALRCPLPDASADSVLSSFGLKTFSPEQLQTLAGEVSRILRPGGTFSFLEISVPPQNLLRWPYTAYVKHIIPLIGKLVMGNPDNYRLLWRYTELFGNCRTAQPAFELAGLEVTFKSYFFGCATSLHGRKPVA